MEAAAAHVSVTERGKTGAGRAHRDRSGGGRCQLLSEAGCGFLQLQSRAGAAQMRTRTRTRVGWRTARGAVMMTVDGTGLPGCSLALQVRRPAGGEEADEEQWSMSECFSPLVRVWLLLLLLRTFAGCKYCNETVLSTTSKFFSISKKGFVCLVILSTFTACLCKEKKNTTACNRTSTGV